METDEFRDALVRRFGPNIAPPRRRLIARLTAPFRPKAPPPDPLGCCVRATNEIVAKACLSIDRQYRYPPGAALPGDYRVLLAFACLVATLVSSAFEDENTIDDVQLWCWTIKHLLGDRLIRDFGDVVNAGFALADEVINLSDANADHWQTTLWVAVDGYVCGQDTLLDDDESYPGIFGMLLTGLIEAEKRRAPA